MNTPGAWVYAHLGPKMSDKKRSFFLTLTFNLNSHDHRVSSLQGNAPVTGSSDRLLAVFVPLHHA